LSIGRESDLVIDATNPNLHRRFLQLYPEHGLWWLGNAGNLLSATVSDTTGALQAWLAPGARLPIVFERLHVMFGAGTSMYELDIVGEDEMFRSSSALMDRSGATIHKPATLTTSQRVYLVALCETLLRNPAAGRSEAPELKAIAARLGWTLRAVNRKLDNLCEKFGKQGVAGLRGKPGEPARHRRSRLVEYAVATRLVTTDDLPLLDQPPPSPGPDDDLD
jgi:hypothetical protein